MTLGQHRPAGAATGLAVGALVGALSARAQPLVVVGSDLLLR